MIGRRRWQRKFPAPPPTPEGYVWATRVDRWGQKKTELVPAAELQAYCQKQIGHLDELDAAARKAAHETGAVPEKQKAADNVFLKGFGIGRAY